MLYRCEIGKHGTNSLGCTQKPVAVISNYRDKNDNNICFVWKTVYLPYSSKQGYKNAREYGYIYNHFKFKEIVPTVVVKKKEYISLTANWPIHTFSGYIFMKKNRCIWISAGINQIFVILASLAIIQQNTVLTSLDYEKWK